MPTITDAQLYGLLMDEEMLGLTDTGGAGAGTGGPFEVVAIPPPVIVEIS
jgi:hypothetical protein